MQFDAHCIECLVRRQFRLAENQSDGAAVYRYMREVLQAILDAPEGAAAPFLIPRFAEIYSRYFHEDDVYAEIKRASNDRVLAILDNCRAIVESAEDPLLTALKFSRTGNFLDFAVLTADVIDQELEKAIAETPSQPLDEIEYAHFRRDLDSAESMLILGDNTGEIVFDILLVEQLKKQYPKLSLAYVVRGGNAQNDATREDAIYVGMDRLVPVLDSGSDIPGTELPCCSEELQQAVASADLLLAKGSANFETLLQCGYNVYYLFLCKCQRFCRLLHQPMMSGMFLNELRTKMESPFAC